MAGGNLGELWMSLGIKETVSDGLKRVRASLDKTDEKSAAVGKEITSFIKELNKAAVPDTLLKSIGRIGELLATSTSGAEGLGRVLKNLNVNELSALGGNIKLSNIKEAHSLITKIMSAMSTSKMSDGAMSKFFDLGNVQAFLTQIMEVDKNLKALKNNSKSISDSSMLNEAKSYIAQFTNLRKQLLDSFNNGTWRGNNGLQDQLSRARGELIQFYDKLNASKGTPSLFDSLQNEASKATAALREASNEIAGMKDKTDKSKESVVKLKYELNEVLNAFRGAASKNLGVGEAGEKGRQLVDILNQINRKKAELEKREGGDKLAAEMGAMVNNAMAYIRLLQRIDIAQRNIADKKSANPNVDTARFKEATNVVTHFREQLTKLESATFITGVDSANVLGNYTRAWQVALGQVDQIIGKFQKRNPLSDLDSNFSKIDAKVERFRNTLEKLRDYMNEGFKKGYSTSMLGDRITGMNGVVAQMEKALANDGKMLSNADRMKQLFNDMIVEMSKSTAALQAYEREKGKAIAQEREWQSLANSGFKGGKFATPGSKESAQGYLDIANAYRKAVESLQIKHGEAENKLNKALDEYSKEIKELESKMKAISPKMDGLNWNGKKLHPTKLAEYEELVKQLEHLKNTKGADNALALAEYDIEAHKIQRLINLIKEYENLAERVAKGTYKPYDANSYEQRRISETLALKNAIIERQKVADEAEKKRKKDNAEATAAEKQRQTELEFSLRRIQSMEKALANLQEKRFTSKMLGLDTSEAEAKINTLKEHIRQLYEIAAMLDSKDMTTVGKLGNLGNGRETQAANDLARSYDKANKEAQKGIEIEQKRQQEIAKTAAKVQSELVRGFEKANIHATKLNSTVQDLKALFMQGGLVFGAQQFAMSIITTGGEMEKQHIAMQSILGDMQNANTLFGQVKELALNSPFTFSELNRDVKQLAAYGVEYENLYDTTKRLADMSSGLGVSFDRIALAFGQVQARGWLDGKELRQIAYAGIPLLSKLSDFYSKQEGRKVSTSEIKTRISNREVSFDDVKSIFWQMTDAGGQFYNMQQTLSETLLGRYNKLKDAWEIMLSDFASGNSLVGRFFKTAIDGATALVQSLHTLALPAGTLFAGYALKKMLAGGTASSFLANKASLAGNIQSKLLQGQQLTQVEKDILATKNQITNADLKALASAKALTLTELNRLRLSGRITAEQYKTYRAIVMQQAAASKTSTTWMRFLASMRSFSLANVWTSFTTSGMAAMRLLGTGLKSLGATLWSAIGGLPGLIISGITVGITYAISEYQELSQKIKQTQDELTDKNNQILSFLKENNVSVAISKGDDKEIDNMIDSYKEKLKQLAPYGYQSMVMTADEKKSHKDRLQYLEQEIKMLKEANDLASSWMKDRGYYSDLNDVTNDALQALERKQKLRDAAMAPGATQDDRNSYEREKAFDNYVESYKKVIEDKFGDIAKDEKVRNAAMQAMSAIFSSLGVPEDKADMIRASVLQAFGIGDKSSWLQGEVGSKMMSLIDTTFPLIGDKIRASIPLNDAEKAKVKELMGDAKNGLIQQYPELEETLKRMLAASKFEAVIKLVLDKDSYNDMQSALIGRIPNYRLSPELLDKYRKRAKEYGQDDNWYKGRNAAQTNINEAYNNWQSAKASKAPNTDKLYQDYQDEMAISRALLYYDYKGEGKKTTNKASYKNRGQQEDEALKRLRKRIELYKKFYSELEKYRKLYGDSGALSMLKSENEFRTVFDTFGLSDPGTYGTSVRELLSRLPMSTNDRKDYRDQEIGNIHAKNRSEEEDRIKAENDQLSKQLDILSEQYDVYKKLNDLTGNSNASSMIAFGHVQSGTFKDYLNEQMKWAVQGHNNMFGTKFTPEDVFGMTETDFKKYFGENSENVSVLYEAMRKENDKIKKETIDMMADLIEKNATISQQIEDENRRYERQLELIKNIEDPTMRQRAKEGADKTHNENSAKLQFEQFKQESDWVTIFDDLDRVSTATIDAMVKNIDDFSRKAGLSVEVVKQLRDAIGKLRSEQIDRNPLPYIFGGVNRGNAIGDIVKENRRVGAGGVNISSAQAKKTGLKEGQYYTNGQLENEQRGAYDDSSTAMTSLSGKFQALSNIMGPVVSLFEALGKQDSILGKLTSGASNAFGAAAQVSGGLSALGLESAGPYGASAAAALSVASSLVSAFGADYSSYNKAKEQYDNLTSIWDALISKKTEYMNIHWGTEATEASKEAQRMLEAEIEQTRIIARKRLKSGASIGSHSIGYRMWKGSYDYNGQNWQDVAPEISKKYGVQFNGMEDLLNMSSDTLSKIKTDFTGLWAMMDEDYRNYLEKLIEYGDKADDMIDNLTEKLTGNKFSSLVESWGDAMSQMSNTSDSLVDNFEENLKKTIVNSMIENLYKDKINAVLDKAKKYGDPTGGTANITDSNGNIVSAYTDSEYSELMGDVEDISKQIEASRDFLKKTYGWSDNSSSSSKNSVNGITEETADLLVSYVNAIRLDVSVIRAEQAKFFPEMSEISKSQLTQLNMISQNTLRNAEAAERIEIVVTSFNDNFNKVLNGTKKLNVK